ncbi:retrovirus-related Pol polyprotein [Elysia marginata]|uniref:Retrovirus-related Pol polyprotein n=1 Tax=Elysia marginata TaxID=1093978 RepID=A0AAV4JKQ6_9GAST|nr:retrovirus-related Pol polyprotein [Elysia marginata]
MGTILKNRNIQFGTKVKVLKAYVWSVLIYGSECWTISKEMEKCLLAVEMWFLRRNFRISWTEKKTNEEVLRLTDTDRSLLRLLRKRQMEFFGHINRHGGLEKLMMHGKVEGRRARGIQRQTFMDSEEVFTTLSAQKETGKRQGGPTVASASAGPRDPQLFVTDSNTGRRFLVDTGAQVSVVPATWFERRSGQSGSPLQAANGTSIPTYGSRNVPLCFNHRTYQAHLIIADVKRPLLGADFFRRHNLLVDLRGQRLIETDTYLSSPCSISRVVTTALALIEQESNTFRKVLQDFPALLQPTFSSTAVKHEVQHHGPTTGPPVHSRARRLAPDKLAVAKQEFMEMEQMGIIRKSNSPWASPLHIVPKPNGGWRPCGDNIRLNNATTPDSYPIPHIFLRSSPGK